MKKKINVKLLRQVQQAIISEPKLYDQNDFMAAVDKDGYTTSLSNKDTCGTKCCIAGWAVKLSIPAGQLKRYIRGQYSTNNKAKKLLWLNHEQAAVLFDGVYDDWENEYFTSWPEKHATAYLKAKTPAGRARAGFNMIEDFIKQNA